MDPPQPADIAPWVYYLVGILLVLANIAAWVATFFTLPGNWVIVALAVLSAFFLPEKPDGLGVGWTAVVFLTLLAVLGEVLELLAGAAGAAKQGASRRSMALALGGAAIGSVLGAVVGLPVPIVGPFIAALGGGAVGAFAGAYLGETWKGREGAERMNISKGALDGRLLGTVGKLIVGVVMVAIATVAAFA
jgi:uncharacterized protein YqgC (DUF456 family)